MFHPDKIEIGKRSAPLVIHVTKEAIREFADAIADPNPLYHDEGAALASGFAGVIAPPTFAIRFGFNRVPGLDFPLAPLEVPPPDARMLYIQHEFSYGEVITAGDTITTQGWVTDIETSEGVMKLDMACEGRNQHQRMAYQATGSFLFFVEENT